MNSYLRTRRGSVTAAVEDLRTDRTWTIGGTTPQAEASVVKVDILEKLLAGSPGGLSSNGQGLARKMITVSDNDSATTLWNAAGGATGIGAYNARAGLSDTKLSACVDCPGFAWPGWGLSQTTPADQLSLLRQLVVPGTLLTPAARRYALSLLENVDPTQRWGVTDGVPASATVALKDGWLPLAAPAGKGAASNWQVNSVGWISGDGRDYLIAIMSTGDPTMQYGEATLGGLSSRVWTALAP
jgi:beta-lactamase class A